MLCVACFILAFTSAVYVVAILLSKMHKWQLLMSCTLPTPKYAIYLAFPKGLRVEKGSFGLHISFVFWWWWWCVCACQCVFGVEGGVICGMNGWTYIIFQHVILPKDLHLIFLWLNHIVCNLTACIINIHRRRCTETWDLSSMKSCSAIIYLPTW